MFQDCEDIASVELNGTALHLEHVDNRLQKTRIAHLLPGANRLELQLLSGDDDTSRLNGEVWLEIIEPPL